MHPAEVVSVPYAPFEPGLPASAIFVSFGEFPTDEREAVGPDEGHVAGLRGLEDLVPVGPEEPALTASILLHRRTSEGVQRRSLVRCRGGGKELDANYDIKVAYGFLPPASTTC